MHSSQLNRQQSGLTLLEVLLVLVIGLSIIVLSLQQYLAYRRDTDTFQVQANVDLIFQASERYFRANCAQGNFKASYAPLTMGVTLDTLMTGGYLTVANNRMQVNPLVDSNSPGQGYIIQFNQFHDPTTGLLPKRLVTLSAGGQAAVGSITIWKAQVAVKILAPEIVTYKNILAAECISSYNAASQNVTPCSQVGVNNTNGDYLVFSRLPSFPTSKTNYNYWLATPTVKQFTQMYQVSPILLLTGGAYTNSQYYICGS